VNAWAIYDRKTESPPGDYTNCLQHEFNQLPVPHGDGSTTISGSRRPGSWQRKTPEVRSPQVTATAVWRWAAGSRPR